MLLGVILAAAVAAACAGREPQGASTKESARPQSAGAAATAVTPAPAHGPANAQGAPAGRVPAFQTAAADLNKLPPTLAPEQFAGKTREAYRAVREIPKTIAQLPCYCHCDEGHGHKSLHSCYEDDHASMCAVCVEEALAAYRMEKEQGLAPAQIRERIVTSYSSRQ